MGGADGEQVLKENWAPAAFARQTAGPPRRQPEKSIKMTPAETARALFYFSPHNNARPTPVGDAAKHIHLPHAREYQGQTPPRS